MPPGSDERQMGAQPNGHTTFSEKNNLRYLQLVRKYSSIILGQFFGHLHSDSFRIIYNDNGKKRTLIYVKIYNTHIHPFVLYSLFTAHFHKHLESGNAFLIILYLIDLQQN